MQGRLQEIKLSSKVPEKRQQEVRDLLIDIENFAFGDISVNESPIKDDHSKTPTATKGPILTSSTKHDTLLN